MTCTRSHDELPELDATRCELLENNSARANERGGLGLGVFPSLLPS